MVPDLEAHSYQAKHTRIFIVTLYVLNRYIFLKLILFNLVT